LSYGIDTCQYLLGASRRAKILSESSETLRRLGVASSGKEERRHKTLSRDYLFLRETVKKSKMYPEILSDYESIKAKGVIPCIMLSFHHVGD
jgi:hypothetical protein